ncbi:MAG TPA: arginine--tRNA ligase [Patescibacteria group bacterium]|nr:arginine--tRNA ligase [Patescibacteria group bacterium]
MQEISEAIKAAVKDLFNVDVEPVLTRPDEQFGDFATNVALQLAKKLNKNPRVIAQQLADKIQSDTIAKTEVAGPGFINICLSDNYLIEQALDQKIAQPLKDQEILVEFGDPNPFKEMHIGHLYSSIVGDAISSLFEANGAEVRRVCYQGDVGLHVAKWLWGVHQELGWDDAAVAKLRDLPHTGIGYYYSLGAKAYEENTEAKTEIDVINTKVYSKEDPQLNKIYELGKRLSFDKFQDIFDLLGIAYKKQYLESQSVEIGLKYVKENTGKVFTHSQGAVIYEGEKVGLHTRVFVTSKGLPTYETKDLGLTELKNTDYPNAARSIIITANEQSEYFKVMLAALSEIDKPLADKTTHLAHGFLSLSSGKMSSRTGDVYGATNLLNLVQNEVKQQYPDTNPENETYLAAIKYAFLKHRLGSDVTVDIKESVSLQGNSGPYLQYAHARACSILAKSPLQGQSKLQGQTLQEGERGLVRKIGEYPEVIEKAAAELMPHHVCMYLYELAQTFNRFYENNKVIGDSRQAGRLQMVKAYADTLKNGLTLLNIPAPEKM